MLSLRKKISVIILSIAIVTAVSMVVIVIYFIKPRLEAKLEKRGASIAHAISFRCINPILTRNFFQLDMVFREFISAEADVAYLFVLAPEGTVTSHSFGREFPVALKTVQPRIDGTGLGVARLRAADRDIIDISLPLLDGRLGRLHVGMSASSIAKDVNEIIGSFSSIAVLVFLSALLMLAFLERWIIRPIVEIRSATARVRDGDLDSRVAVRSADELGSLAAGFNVMLDAIKESRATLVQEKLLLAQSEERFRKIIEQSPISMAVVSMDGTIDYINICAVETFGYQPADIPHMSDWWQKAYPDAAYRDFVVAQWMGLVETAIAENRYIERREYLVTCKDGTIKTMMIFGVLVANKVFVMFEDITERKRMEERLRESESRYQVFTSITSDFVYMCTRRANEPFRVQWMAGATEAITGYAIDELKQRACWLSIVYPDDKQRVDDFLMALAPGIRDSIDFRIITKGGDVRWIHESSYCEAGSTPEELCHYGSSQDITGRKQVEDEIHRLNGDLEKLVAERTDELLRSNRDLASFCYAISHELRAPVARLKGLSQALQEELAENPADAAYCAQRIEVASNELQRVINSVLQLSRLSQASFVPQRLDLSALVRDVADALVSEHPERRVEVIVAAGITVSADAPLLRLCLENLLGNAFKYTARLPQARIEFGLDAGRGAYFVRDNGIGFDMAYAENLFEPFARLHPDEEFGGSGIGLATVQRVIERHGGRIWAESAVGQGATFYFQLSPVRGAGHDA